ncbi:MAG: response regulator transcription factor [Pirellulales bacterium]|nr:response regulator transcription factor [Pirellulales bacterium]MBX3434841.1 response regulator transcription factor [Pirellulales bacterium]
MTDHAVVYAIDDDAASRKAVTALVGALGVEAVGFSSAEEFLSAYQGRRPAVIVTDVRMLGMSGVELQEELHRRGVAIPVIVMTAYASTQLTVRAMRNGAVTLLEKPCNENELWEAIRDSLAADREAWQLELQRIDTQARLRLMSEKERQVLDCMIAGDANKVTARKLDVSVRTVENHRRKVFEKMGVDSVAELVRLVLLAEPGES